MTEEKVPKAILAKQMPDAREAPARRPYRG